MSNQADHIIARVRLPPELRDKIADSAKSHNRSMNADMVARLEQSFSDTEKTDLSSLLAEMRELRLEAQEMRMLYVEALQRKP